MIRLATDFETFTMALNKLHSALVDLQDANRDVLLGKRSTNCLSCGKGNEAASHSFVGKDGKLYKGDLKVTASTFVDEACSTT